MDQEVFDTQLAMTIARAIFSHRSIMGSSKAYEGATDIDILLCEVSTPIVRLAYGKDLRLIPFLKSELYYSNYPERFNRTTLELEIEEIRAGL
ncbi:hypothetical protein [Pedobacter sp. SYSU D00535]|uniref:hypothetical protein n=1 Tax=Pedobacter sp. SYSU D00535 TaxID=2810308 RepID=UPI001A96766C|nr:hypothetical protein [Pedobacter sp. SYSU D00535]